jgi:hypothetical protein
MKAGIEDRKGSDFSPDVGLWSRAAIARAFLF